MIYNKLVSKRKVITGMSLKKKNRLNKTNSNIGGVLMTKNILPVILIALIATLAFQTAISAETTKYPSKASSRKELTKMSRETTEMRSPFGLLDPIIDTPTMNNSEYYKELGIKWLAFSRENAFLGWQSIEKEKGKYDFTSHDEDICSFYSQGISLIYETRPVNKVYGTTWNEGVRAETNEYPAGHLKEWGDFVRKLVERYDGDGLSDAPCSTKINIKYYQLVHELQLPTLSYDYWTGNPKEYAEVFETTYKAMNKACNDCVLIMPVPPSLSLEGMNGKDDFLTIVLGYLKDKDIKNIGFDYHFWGDYRKRLQFIEKINDYATSNGFTAVKIFSNESGAPSFEGAEADQANYVIKSYVSGIAHGQTKQFWTRVFDYSGGTPLWMDIGLMTNYRAGEPPHKKLAFFTYKKMVEVLEGSDWSKVNILSEKNGVYAYKFIKGNKTVWVAWNDNPEEKELHITDITSSQVKVTEAIPGYSSGKNIKDHKPAFKERKMDVEKGIIRVRLGNRPVFIEQITI